MVPSESRAGGSAPGPVSGDERAARAALLRVADPGDPVMGRLVDRLGAVGILRRIHAGGDMRALARELTAELTGAAAGAGAASVGTVGAGSAASGDGGPRPAAAGSPRDLPRLLAAWRARAEAVDPARDLAAGEALGARLVVPGDIEWPTQLDDLGFARPYGLWLHGDADLRFSCLKSVAIVGSRAATAYGTHVAAELGGALGDAGWTVVSGGAYGIDGAAHRSAVAGASPTIVVLACGTDVDYPLGHHDLFRVVREHGLLVSECPPGVRPTRLRFLVRNRLIAALSRGTIVVEAALRSGALNTAGHAESLRRPVGAVPGPVTSGTSAGCHQLIRQGKAVCVTNAAEVIELAGAIGDDLAPRRRGPVLPRDALSEPMRRVLDAVPARVGTGPAGIAVAAGVDLSTALSCLGGLAAAGYVERSGRGWRLRPAATR